MSTLLTMAQLLQLASKYVTQMPASKALPLCEAQNGVLIDIREPSEVAALPVANAINIPRGVLEPQLLNLIKEDDTPIYLHCAGGTRATLAAEQLQRLGYKHVIAISCKAEDIAKLCANK